MPEALSNLLIVDLGDSVATAYCGKLCAALGARVVNVEAHPHGHRTRRLPPALGSANADGVENADGVANGSSERSALHAWLSARKESVLLDASQDESVERIRVLCDSADAVLVQYDDAIAPVASIFDGCEGPLRVCLSWFGRTGPLQGTTSRDVLLTSMTGTLRGFGPADEPPLLPAGYQAQIIGGATAFVATLGRLIASHRGDGPRGVLDVSILESNLCLSEAGAPGLFNTGWLPERQGVNRFWPTYPGGIYECSDGFIGVTALTPSQWQTFCRMLDLPDLAAEPRYHVTLQRLFDADLLDARIAPKMLERKAEDWFHAAQAARLPFALVPTVADLLSSTQFTDRQAFARIEYDGGASFLSPSVPFHLAATPVRASGRSPRLGEHNGNLETSAPQRQESTRSTATPCSDGDMLRGVRVIDLSMGWAGPLAARHLADLGAEVIKVESCRHFDWWRGWDLTPEALALRAWEKSTAFNMVNRNKRAITLDLACDRGAEILKKLVREADAVVENFAGTVMPKLGLEYEVLRKVNPSLVMLSMPPFGATGDWKAYRAYGSTIEQASGLPHFQGEADGPPAMQHVALGDPVAGLNGAAALLTALWYREVSGEGQHIDLSHVESVIPLGVHGFLEHTVMGRDFERRGRRHPRLAPHGVYSCQGHNRWITITIETDEQWRTLASFMAEGIKPEMWPQEDRFSTAERRKSEEDELDRLLSLWTADRDRDLLSTKLRTLGVPCAPLYDGGDLLRDPQLAARGFWQWIEREHVGLQPQPSAPYRSTPEPSPISRPAPTLGEHNQEVLGELLGMSEAEIEELAASGVIGTEPLLD